MDTVQMILHGFSVALTLTNLMYVFAGVLLGTMIGVLPGIGPATGVALLIPLTFNADPTSALIMMAGLYYGAMYGGSTTSILINTPGESSSVMTAIDGYQMARNGRPGAALAISAIGSFIAGTFGVLALTIMAVPLAEFAIQFGPAEYFGLMVFALAAVTSLSGRSLLKGLISTIVGLMVATVGIDLQSGVVRYNFGVSALQDGVEFLVVVVGLFALGEVLVSLEDLHAGRSQPIKLVGRVWLTLEEWRRSIGPILRGSVIGFFTGVLPGAGGTVASIISYTMEKRISKRPDEFGKGAIEGVAGPESANNASTAGAMVPLLTLGIPGSATTAVLVGALIMYGIQPGPMLFQKNPELVWGLVDSMYIGNAMLLILNVPLVGLFVQMLRIPVALLLPMIIGISSVGVYALNNNVVDLYVLVLFGVVGYIMRKLEVPPAPFVLAVVLGKILEQSMRQALVISGGDPSIFVTTPIGAAFLALAIIFALLPLVSKTLQSARAGRDAEMA